MTPVLKADGTIRFFIKQTSYGKDVFSPAGVRLGYIAYGKTFNGSGQLVSLGEDPGILVD